MDSFVSALMKQTRAGCRAIDEMAYL